MHPSRWTVVSQQTIYVDYLDAFWCAHCWIMIHQPLMKSDAPTLMPPNATKHDALWITPWCSWSHVYSDAINLDALWCTLIHPYASLDAPWCTHLHCWHWEGSGPANDEQQQGADGVQGTHAGGREVDGWRGDLMGISVYGCGRA